jgi:hypothetical protein
MKKLIAMAAVVGLLSVVGCKSRDNQGGSDMDYGNTPADTGTSSYPNNVMPPSNTTTNSSDINGNAGGTGITPGGTSSGASSSSDTSSQGNVPNTSSNTNLNNNGQPQQ